MKLYLNIKHFKQFFISKDLKVTKLVDFNYNITVFFYLDIYSFKFFSSRIQHNNIYNIDINVNSIKMFIFYFFNFQSNNLNYLIKLYLIKQKF